ncbi:hypothetical protein Tco_1100437 [Tanacetum coccineum]
MKSFVMELNVNIVAWNYLVNGMLFNLIKNLYVPFGIPFDPKRYYKDGDCARMLRSPRDPMLRLYHRLIVYSISRRSRALEKEEAGAMISRGPTRHEGDAGGVIEKALVAPGGGDEDKEMPQAVPPPPRTQGERITRLEEEVHGMHEALQGQREVLDSMACDFSRFTTWTVTSLARLMDRAGVPYTRYSKSPIEHQRCTRQRADGVATSTAPQQPDP